MKLIVSDAGKSSGVVEFCLLVLLFCFDIVVDILPDYMHMLKNILPGHLLLVLNGNRVPNAPKYKNATKVTTTRRRVLLPAKPMPSGSPGGWKR